MLAQGLRIKETTYPSAPITTPAIQTGSDRFPAQVIGSRVGMPKGMNHYLQNDSQQGSSAGWRCCLSYLLLCPRHRHRRPGGDSRPAEHAKALDKEQGARSKESGGSRERGGGIDTAENLIAIVKAWDVLLRSSATWVREV